MLFPQYVHQPVLLDKKKLKDDFFGMAFNLDFFLKKVKNKNKK